MNTNRIIFTAILIVLSVACAWAGGPETQVVPRSEFDALSNTVNAVTTITTYQPSLTPGSGAITSATATGTYTMIGKSMLVNIAVVVTTKGTAGGHLAISLPAGLTAKTGASFSASEVATTGAAGISFVSAGNSSILLYSSAYGSPFLADGSTWLISGVLNVLP